MKVLMINKFLHPNGGSETYIFKLGEELKCQGHEVQYFGMEHEGRCVGNSVDAYTSDMDFHGGSIISKLSYPLKTIYSSEARKKIRLVLDDFQPDICHLNNFNYQLTPSIILEIRKWEKETNHRVKIIFTAHDYQLVCPNHMLYNPNTNEVCEKCIGGHFLNCTKGKCIHGSMAKSLIGTMEASFWKWKNVYEQIDTIICCSRFMKSKMDTNPIFANKTIAMHNFTDFTSVGEREKGEYVLYFGRYTEEKGVDYLIEACKKLPNIPFVFAGNGPLAELMENVKNIKNVGFQSSVNLNELIRKAKFSICPTVVNENCPFSVMESQELGTPVLGTKVGGVPELIEDEVTGRLVDSKDADMLADVIQDMWMHPETVEFYSSNCKKIKRDNLNEYSLKLIDLYKSGGGQR